MMQDGRVRHDEEGVKVVTMAGMVEGRECCVKA